MKRRMLFLLLLTVLVLSGCTFTLPENIRETVPYYAGHTDHVAPVARNRSGFFIDTVQNEATIHYLSYREPDGCVTHIHSFDPWDKPADLYCVGNTFYYINHEGAESEGVIRSVTFMGETAVLAAGELTLNYIIRTDDGYIYCAAERGETYVRIPLDLSCWDEIEREEAIK